MNIIRIEPNRTITTNQFNTKADFAPSELSMAIAKRTGQELMTIRYHQHKPIHRLQAVKERTNNRVLSSTHMSRTI